MDNQSTLFGQVDAPGVSTEGIKYAGSKLKLIPHILELAQSVPARTAFDAFSGTTRVSQALAQAGFTVASNDIAEWSRVFATCYLGHSRCSASFEELIRHLASVSPAEGWLTKTYGGDDRDGSSIQIDGLKRPWQRHNTRRADGIRMEIQRLCLDPVDEAVALTSLILALDRVDSTLGHYVSYLRDWSPRSYNDLELRTPRMFEHGGGHSITCSDVFEAARHVSADLAYVDPPYGSNNEKMPPSRVRYASYYHVWKSICLNDEPEVFGKARRRKDSSDTVAGSPFEEFRRSPSGRFIALEAIEQVLDAIKARWIILSYSSGGRATAEELNDLISRKYRLLRTIEVDYKRNVMAEMSWTREWLREAEKPNREFLFLLEKS